MYTEKYKDHHEFHQDQCQEHTSEPITNFCSNIDCLKPLCPECIDIHNKLHHSQNTLPQISSLKNAKLNCNKKVNAAILALNQEIENPTLQFIIDPNHSMKEENKKLIIFKEKLNSIIDEHINQLENTIKRNINMSNFRSNDVNEVYERMKSMMSDLEYLSKNIDGGNSLQVLRKICSMDLKSIMDKFKSDLNKSLQKRNSDGLSIIYDESQLSSFKEFLNKFIYLSKPIEKNIEGYFSPPKSKNSNYFENNSNKYNPQPNMNSYQPINLSPENINPRGDSSNNLAKSRGDTFYITERDTFDQKSNKKYLHFFQNDENILHILDLDELKNNFKTKFTRISLKIDFRIPPFHKSLSLSNGDLYLIGGSIMDDVSKSKSSNIYKYIFEKNILIQAGNLIFPRSSHSVCFIGNMIYIIGGFGNKQTMLGECEKFNVSTQKSQQIASLNYPAASLCICSFYQNYIFKFGGMEIQHNLSPYIEKYSIKDDKWTVLDPRLNINTPENYFALLSNSCCVQINKNDIMICGGYLEDNTGSDQTFILNYDHNNLNDDNTMIKSVNEKILPFGEGFWNNQCIIYERSVFALQNISHEKNDDCLEDQRRILMFNGKEWKNLN